MNEKTIDYIFGELKQIKHVLGSAAKFATAIEEAFDNTAKVLIAAKRKQKVLEFILGAGAVAIFLGTRRLQKLSKEVEELKESKGA